MAETSANRPTRDDVSKALSKALARLRSRQDESLPETCADLWEDSLELIELLIAIEEELQNGLRANHELDFRACPPRTAKTTEFIDWIMGELESVVVVFRAVFTGKKTVEESRQVVATGFIGGKINQI